MSTPPYIELHAHSAFSFLDGASSPLELAGAAAALGYPALALTDHDGIWGSMEFAHAAKGLGLRPITGAELTVRLPSQADVDGPKTPGAHGRFSAHQHVHLTLLVEEERGYRNLCRLLDGGARSYAGQHGAGGGTGLDDAGGSRGARGGARLSVGMRAGRGARRGLRARGHGARGEARAAAPRRLRAGPLPGRAAASLLAAGPGAQPLAGAARRAARRPHRRHRQRPLPRPLALPRSRTPSSRSG